MVVATIVNVLLTILFFFIGFLLMARFANPEDENSTTIWIMLVFIISIGLSWFVYSRLIKWFSKKVNLEENFAPIFESKRRKATVRKKKNEGDGIKE